MDALYGLSGPSFGYSMYNLYKLQLLLALLSLHGPFFTSLVVVYLHVHQLELSVPILFVCKLHIYTGHSESKTESYGVLKTKLGQQHGCGLASYSYVFGASQLHSS